MRALGLLGQVDLPAEDAAVPRARRYVRDLLNGVGHPQADDALLLVSELVTNSVRHSDSGRAPGGRVVVAASVHNGTLHIEVIDAGSAGRRPYVSSDVSPDSGGGRGLWLVQELSSAWGWYETTAGRVVWFQLASREVQEVPTSQRRGGDAGELGEEAVDLLLQRGPGKVGLVDPHGNGTVDGRPQVE